MIGFFVHLFASAMHLLLTSVTPLFRTVNHLRIVPRAFDKYACCYV